MCKTMLKSLLKSRCMTPTSSFYSENRFTLIYFCSGLSGMFCALSLIHLSDILHVDAHRSVFCCWFCFLIFFFLPFEEVNLTIFLFHKSTFLVLCLKEVVIYRTVLLGVAEYSDITGSLLLVALKTIFPLIYFFIRTPFFVPQVSSHSLFVYQFPHNTSLFQVIFSASSLLLSFFISS